MDLRSLIDPQLIIIYDRIFNPKDLHHRKRKVDILKTAENFKAVYAEGSTDVYTSAAANFALRMVEKPSENETDFKDFCAYFEFAFAEFKFIYFTLLTKKCDYDGRTDDNLLSLYSNVPDYILQDRYYNNQPLMKITNFLQLSEGAYESLKSQYFKYLDDVKKSLVYTGKDKPCDTQYSRVREIRKMAMNNGVKFSNKPSAVYHWRKHSIQDIFEHRLTKDEITPRQYLNEANHVCQSKNASLTTKDGSYLFQLTYPAGRTDIGSAVYDEHIKLVFVTMNNLVELVSYYKIPSNQPKTGNKKTSRSGQSAGNTLYDYIKRALETQ
jgi:hypothetical protein